MRLTNDDLLFQVDSRFLGPKGWDLPWHARYASYAIGFGVLILVLIVERRTGIVLATGSKSNIWTFLSSVTTTLMITVAITTVLMTLVDHDRPVRSVVMTFGLEVSAPRDPRPVSYTFRPPRLVEQ